MITPSYYYDCQDYFYELINNWEAKRKDKNIMLTNTVNTSTIDTSLSSITRAAYEQYKSPLSSTFTFDILRDLSPKKVINITPKRIVKNGPALVVFWEDGTKTVVKRKKGEQDNVYHAFTAALAKKLYGSNSAINRIVDGVIDETKKSDKKNKK